MSDNMVYLDNSVALQASKLYNVDAANMTITGTLSHESMNVSNTITNIQTVLSQRVFLDAVKNYEEKFENFSEEQMIELMKAFSYEVWQYYPYFQKHYAAFKIKEDGAVSCKIINGKQDLMRAILDEYKAYFEFMM